MRIPKSAEIESAMEALSAPGQIFEVAPCTIDGIDYKAFKNQPASMRQISLLCLQHGEADFLVLEGERLSFAETYRRAAIVANALTGRFAIRKGDRVGLAGRNSMEWVIAALAILNSGAILVPYNAWWQAGEMAYGLSDAEPAVIFADKRRLAILEGLAEAEGIRFIALSEDYRGASEASIDDLIADGGPETMPDVDVAPDDDVLILYTSGTTGYPKGAVTTNRALVAATMSLAGMAAATKAAMVGPEGEMPFQPAALVAGPLFHVAAFQIGFLMSMAIGRKVVMVSKWDAEEVLRLVEEEKITNCGGISAMTLDLIEAARKSDRDLPTLLDLTMGGAPFPPSSVGEVPEVFPGARPTCIYGLTETNAMGTVITRDAYLGRPASVGKAMAPLVEIRIADEAGATLPAAETGEILVKCVANCRAYWKRPEDSAAAFRDGWHLTGDLGYLDEEGYLFIVDRKKDIIIRGGENISSVEVEGVIFRHENVVEAAVFGLPDQRLGEIVAAVVRPQEGAEVDVEELKAFVAENLAYFKVPERVFVTAEPIPKTATLKFDKATLRQIYAGK